MNYKVQTQTIVRENETKYTAVKSKEVQLWIVNTDGGVLIKNQSGDISSICNLTISGISKEDIYKKVGSEVGILCSAEYLKPCFNTIINDCEVDAYLIAINLGAEHKELIESKFNGTFIDYRELMSALSKRNICNSCKESLLNLISTLYDKYNFI